MGVFNKIKDLVGLEDIEEDEEDEVEEVKKVEKKEEIRDVKMPERSFQRPAPAPVREMQKPEAPRMAGRSTTTSDIMKMIVVEPQGFEDCPKLVDSLKAKKPVVINLENLETETARRIFEFLSGATYALNGNVQKIANNIFVFAPANVDVAYNPTQKAHTSEAPISNPWKL